jgi:hypothetical protein
MFSHDVIRRATLAGMIALGTACTAAAQTSPPAAAATGLGESWPNSPDVSANPNWHVYVFHKDGIRYVQINDRNGNILAAVGEATGMVFALPIGMDAQRVQVSSARDGGITSQPVYQDAEVTLMMAPQDDGSLGVLAMSSCTDPGVCTGGRVLDTVE